MPEIQQKRIKIVFPRPAPRVAAVLCSALTGLSCIPWLILRYFNSSLRDVEIWSFVLFLILSVLLVDPRSLARLSDSVDAAIYATFHSFNIVLNLAIASGVLNIILIISGSHAEKSVFRSEFLLIVLLLANLFALYQTIKLEALLDQKKS